MYFFFIVFHSPVHWKYRTSQHCIFIHKINQILPRYIVKIVCGIKTDQWFITCVMFHGNSTGLKKHYTNNLSRLSSYVYSWCIFGTIVATVRPSLMVWTRGSSYHTDAVFRVLGFLSERWVQHILGILCYVPDLLCFIANGIVGFNPTYSSFNLLYRLLSQCRESNQNISNGKYFVIYWHIFAIRRYLYESCRKIKNDIQYD